MNEIYWITRIDVIHVIAIVGIFVSACFFLFYFIFFFFFFIGEIDEEDLPSFSKGSWKRMLVVGIVSVIIEVFVPTKRDLLMIYGIGGIVDYVKQNDTAKNLPDKAIIALDKYLQTIQEDEEK